MPENNLWKLQPGVAIDNKVAEDVAKMACALKSLSAYTTFACENEDAPADLQQIVNDGLDAMKRVFVW